MGRGDRGKGRFFDHDGGCQQVCSFYDMKSHQAVGLNLCCGYGEQGGIPTPNDARGHLEKYLNDDSAHMDMIMSCVAQRTQRADG